MVRLSVRDSHVSIQVVQHQTGGFSLSTDVKRVLGHRQSRVIRAETNHIVCLEIRRLQSKQLGFPPALPDPTHSSTSVHGAFAVAYHL